MNVPDRDCERVAHCIVVALEMEILVGRYY